MLGVPQVADHMEVVHNPDMLLVVVGHMCLEGPQGEGGAREGAHHDLGACTGGEHLEALAQHPAYPVGDRAHHVDHEPCQVAHDHRDGTCCGAQSDLHDPAHLSDPLCAQ